MRLVGPTPRELCMNYVLIIPPIQQASPRLVYQSGPGLGRLILCHWVEDVGTNSRDYEII